MDHTEMSLNEPRRARPRRWLPAAALAGVMLAGAACTSSTSNSTTTTTTPGGSTTTTVAPNKLLGTPNPAKGTPVKIGWISDGKTAAVDFGAETPATVATVKYLNAYKGGLAGHPIDLVTCNSAGTPSQTTSCANTLVQDKVAAVLVGLLQNPNQAWTVVHTAGIPWIGLGISYPTALTDTKTSLFMDNLFGMLVNLPAEIAKQHHLTNVTVVGPSFSGSPIGFYTAIGKAAFAKAGVTMSVVGIPAGTADMTPQMQNIASEGSAAGVVYLAGNDSFCENALKGLRAVNFTGPIAMISPCWSPAFEAAIPPAQRNGVTVAALAPIGTKDHDLLVYQAAMNKYGASQVADQMYGTSTYSIFAGLNLVLAKAKGTLTPASISSAYHTMPNMKLPLSGGLWFRCDGQAITTASEPFATPAVCGTGVLTFTYNAQGKMSNWQTIGNHKIS
jgi:ABC-type branched-subunit amino acid transport system substrate-binding protein